MKPFTLLPPGPLVVTAVRRMLVHDRRTRTGRPPPTGLPEISGRLRPTQQSMPPSIHPCPFAIAADGTTFVNEALFDEVDEPCEILERALTEPGQVFIGIVLDDQDLESSRPELQLPAVKHLRSWSGGGSAWLGNHKGELPPNRAADGDHQEDKQPPCDRPHSSGTCRVQVQVPVGGSGKALRTIRACIRRRCRPARGTRGNCSRGWSAWKLRGRRCRRRANSG